MDLDFPGIESRFCEDITELYLHGERFALVTQIEGCFFIVDTFFDEEVHVCFSSRSTTCYAMGLALEFEYWNEPERRGREA